MSRFYRYLGIRLVYTGVTLLAVSAVLFFVTQVLPGNAAEMILGRYASPERIEVLEQELGLDQPIYVQYLTWLQGILVGDWGTSFTHNQPVMDVILPRFVRSLQLAALTMITVILVGIPLGVIAAVKRGSKTDSLISGMTYLGVSLPEFVTGTLLILLVAGPVLSIFPSGNYVSPREGIIPWLSHMILPTVTLTIILTAHIMRQTRSGMIETLQSEYIRTARLKGLSEPVVLYRHALRNGLLSTITVLALHSGWLMGGLIVVEEVFIYPGLGRLVVSAIFNRDLPVLQMSVLIIAVTYVFANLIADLIYTRFDPRITFGGGE